MRVLVVLLACLCGSASAERLRSPNGDVRDVPEDSVSFALKDGYTRLGRVYYKDPNGNVVPVYDEPAALSDVEARGWWRMTKSEVEAYEQAQRKEAWESEMERGHEWWRSPWFWVGAVLVIAVLSAALLIPIRKKQ